MRVLVLGAGLMGAQIGCEYALHGHEVTFVARDLERARRRVEDALGLAERLGIGPGGERGATAFGDDGGAYDLVVESLPEDLELKASELRPVADRSPAAPVASNTSSLSITALGDAVGAPERTLGAHYWNPPLLSPLVEVVPGERTHPSVVERLRETVAGLGKRPVLVERDVPGFIWNRLQMAVLRECVWLVEQGVAAPEVVDEVVREGLARRWRHVGPFAAVALGGTETWERAAANLLPELSCARAVADLGRFAPQGADLAELAAARDRALALELRG